MWKNKKQTASRKKTMKKQRIIKLSDDLELKMRVKKAREAAKVKLKEQSK